MSDERKRNSPFHPITPSPIRPLKLPSENHPIRFMLHEKVLQKVANLYFSQHQICLRRFPEIKISSLFWKSQSYIHHR